MDGELSAEGLRGLLESESDIRVVDIRSPAAFHRGHIPGSENVPFGDVAAPERRRRPDVNDADVGVRRQQLV